jgi:hypothetical protein
MPGDNGFWFDDDESRVPLWPEAQESNPKESVPRSKFWAIDGTLPDDDLMPKSEDFGLKCGTRSKAGEKA